MPDIAAQAVLVGGIGAAAYWQAPFRFYLGESLTKRV